MKMELVSRYFAVPAKAGSKKVDTGSREDIASKQKSRASVLNF
jgi:hypothetical protein